MRVGSFAARYLWLVGVAIYIGVVWRLGWDKTLGAIASVPTGVFLALLGLEAACEWFRALKWRLALGPGANSVALFFVSKAGGYFSPGRVGELAPLLMPKHRTPRVAAWIVVDRLMEMAGTLGLGAVGIVMMRSTADSLLWPLVAVTFLVILLPLFLVTRRRLFLWLGARAKQESLTHRTAMMLAGVSEEVLLLRKRIVLPALMTLVVTCVDLVAGIVLYRGFGYTVSFPVIAMTSCAHGITAAIPFTPGATGIPYVTAAIVLKQFGSIPFEIVAAAVPVHLAVVNAVFWPSFAIGVHGLRKHMQRP